jgi:anti-sigma regulatory factor (Ser/Thr protein kinase)
LHQTLELRIANRLEEIPAVSARFEELAEAIQLPAKIVTHILIVLDEILSNVIKFAPDAREVAVSFDISAGRVEIEIADDGRPFDPVRDPGQAPETTPRGLPLGGRGLMLVHKLMNEMRYERSGGWNRLTLVKHLTPQPSA